MRREGPVEDALQTLDLGFATVQLLGDLQASGEIIASQLKRFDPALSLPLVETAIEVGQQTVAVW